MSQNDDEIEQAAEDSARILDAGLLSLPGEGGFGIVYLAQQQHQRWVLRRRSTSTSGAWGPSTLGESKLTRWTPPLTPASLPATTLFIAKQKPMPTCGSGQPPWVEDCPGIHPLARRGDSGARSMARLDISSPSLSEGGTMGFQFYVLPSGRKVGVR